MYFRYSVVRSVWPDVRQTNFPFPGPEAKVPLVITPNFFGG